MGRTPAPSLRRRSSGDPHAHGRWMVPFEARPPLSVFSPWRIERRSINQSSNFTASVSFPAPSLSRRRGRAHHRPHPDLLSDVCQFVYYIASQRQIPGEPRAAGHATPVSRVDRSRLARSVTNKNVRLIAYGLESGPPLLEWVASRPRY